MRVCRDRQGECDRKRAAYAAPYSHMAPAPRNRRATDVCQAEQRVHGEGAGGEHDQVSPERQTSDCNEASRRHRDSNHQKENPVEDEREDVPEAEQLSPLQSTSRASVARHHNPGYDDGYDTGGVENIGTQIGAVGDHKRDHDLQLRLVHQTEKQDPERTDAEPENNAHAGHEDEAQRPIQEGGMPAEDGAQDGRENGDSGAVVEQALAFEYGFETQWCTHLAQEVDDSDRIGGGHDGTEGGGACPIEVQAKVGHGAD